MSDLIVLLYNHGYASDTPVYVSWLDDVYYIAQPTQHTFKLATTAGGTQYVRYTEDITDGYVRQIEPVSDVHISGLDFLEGKTVMIVIDGSYSDLQTVVNGSVTLPRVYNQQCIIGLPYMAKFRNVKLEIFGDTGGGYNQTTQNLIKDIKEIYIRYRRSGDFMAGQEVRNTDYVQELTVSYSDAAQDVRVLPAGGFSPDAYIIIKSVKPYPLSVLSIQVKLEVFQV